MSELFAPSRQSEVDIISGSPEGVRRDQCGAIVTDGLTGNGYLKSTPLGTATGWKRIPTTFDLRSFASLNAAVAVAQEGDSIYLPSGSEFQVSETQTISKRLRIYGEGTILAAVPLAPILKVTADSCRIDGITIRSTGETTTTWEQLITEHGINHAWERAGIYIEADYCTVQDVVVENTSTGFRTQATTGTVFERCRATNNWLTSSQTEYNQSSGFNFRADNGVQANNLRADGFGQGLLILSTGQNINVMGLEVNDSVDNGIYGSSVENSSFGFIIAKNIGQAAYKVRGRNVTCTMLIVDGCDIGASLNPIAAVPEADSYEGLYTVARGLPANHYFNGHNLVLNGFAIRGCSRHGIHINTSSTGGNTIYAHGVLIANGGLIDVANDDGNHGIFDLGDGTIISNVQIDTYGIGASTYGVYCSGPNPSTFRASGPSIDTCRLRSPSSPNGVAIQQYQHASVSNCKTDAATIGFNFIDVAGGRVVSNRGTGAGQMRFSGTASSGFNLLNNAFTGLLVFATAPTSSRFINNEFSGYPADTTNVWKDQVNPPAQDSANAFQWDATTGNVGIGFAPDATNRALIRKNQNASTSLGITNTTAGGAAESALNMAANDASAFFAIRGSSYTTSLFRKALLAQLNSNALKFLFYAPFTNQTFDVHTTNGAGATALSFQLDGSSTAGHTRQLVYDVDSGLLQRVKVGANGTGPGGIGRALYIDNV